MLLMVSKSGYASEDSGLRRGWVDSEIALGPLRGWVDSGLRRGWVDSEIPLGSPKGVGGF